MLIIKCYFNRILMRTRRDAKDVVREIVAMATLFAEKKKTKKKFSLSPFIFEIICSASTDDDAVIIMKAHYVW